MDNKVVQWVTRSTPLESRGAWKRFVQERKGFDDGGQVIGQKTNLTKEIQELGRTKSARLKKEKAAAKFPAIDNYIKENIDKPDFKNTDVQKKFNTTHGTVKNRIIALGLEDKARTQGGNVSTSPEMDKFRKWLDNKIAKGKTSFASKKALLDSYPLVKNKNFNIQSAYDVLNTQQNYADVFKFADSKATQFKNYLQEKITNKKGSGKIKMTMSELLKDFKSKTKIDFNATDADRIITGGDKKGDSIFKKHFNIVGSKQRWDEAIVRVAQELKIDPDANEAQLAKQIYGTDNIKNLKNVRADVSKFSEFLVGARKVGGLSLSNYSLAQRQELLGHIHYPGVFKFGTGLIGDRMITVRDYLLKPSSRTLRSMLETLKPELGRDRIDIDEVIGRSATYEKAPGYTELGQVLESKINQDKGRLLDKDFSRIFTQIMDGQTKDFTLDGKKYNSVEDVAKAWNTKSSKFAKDYGIHTAKLRVGKDLDPSKLVKHFNLLTPEAQKDILRVAKTKGIAIQTKALPMGAMADIWEARSKGINPRSLPSYKQIVPEFKKQVYATGDKDYIKIMIERIGCPGKAAGGRVGFKEGTNCFGKGVDKINSGKIKPGAEARNFGNVLKASGATNVNKLRILAKWGILPEAAFVVGHSLFGLGMGDNLPEALKRASDYILPGDQTLSADFDKVKRTLGNDAANLFKSAQIYKKNLDKLDSLKQSKDNALALSGEGDFDYMTAGMTEEDINKYYDKHIKEQEEKIRMSSVSADNLIRGERIGEEAYDISKANPSGMFEDTWLDKKFGIKGPNIGKAIQDMKVWGKENPPVEDESGLNIDLTPITKTQEQLNLNLLPDLRQNLSVTPQHLSEIVDRAVEEQGLSLSEAYKMYETLYRYYGGLHESSLSDLASVFGGEQVYGAQGRPADKLLPPGASFSEQLQTGSFAGGGIAGIRRPHAIPPKSGPMPQGGGLSSMFNRVRKW